MSLRAVVLASFLAVCALPARAEPALYTFALTFAKGWVYQDQLVLQGPAPYAAYVSEGADKRVGLAGLEAWFKALWTPGKAMATPPQAVLVVEDMDGAMSPVLAVDQPRQAEGGLLVFDKVQWLQGRLPGATFGAGTLFIDGVDVSDLDGRVLGRSRTK